MTTIPCALPRNSRVRVSADSAWPLRRSDGTRWCDPFESQAKIGDEVRGDQTQHYPCMEPVSRAVDGRSSTATSEIMDVTAGETAQLPERKRIAAMPWWKRVLGKECK